MGKPALTSIKRCRFVLPGAGGFKRASRSTEYGLNTTGNSSICLIVSIWWGSGFGGIHLLQLTLLNLCIIESQGPFNEFFLIFCQGHESEQPGWPTSWLQNGEILDSAPVDTPSWLQTFQKSGPFITHRDGVLERVLHTVVCLSNSVGLDHSAEGLEVWSAQWHACIFSLKGMHALLQWYLYVRNSNALCSCEVASTAMAHFWFIPCVRFCNDTYMRNLNQSQTCVIAFHSGRNGSCISPTSTAFWGLCCVQARFKVVRAFLRRAAAVGALHPCERRPQWCHGTTSLG